MVCVVACRPTPSPSEPAAAIDRAPVAIEPSPARHIGAGADATECPMHVNGPVDDSGVHEWHGWSARLLHLCQGDPDTRTEAQWVYTLPDGCSEMRSEITVMFADGVVVSTKVTNHHTGEICDF